MNMDETIAHKTILYVCSSFSIVVGLVPLVFGILLL